MNDFHLIHAEWRYHTGTPLGRLGRRIPAATGTLLGLGGRTAAVAIATATAFSQDYDRTRLAAGVFAALIALTVLLPWGRFGGGMAWLGAGFAFFGGAALAAAGFAGAMVAAGAAAALGAAITDAHARRVPNLLLFFLACVLTGALVAAMVFTLEG